MKKIYKTPVAEFVETELLPILTIISPSTTIKKGSSGNQATDEYVGSWEDMWNAM